MTHGLSEMAGSLPIPARKDDKCWVLRSLVKKQTLRAQVPSSLTGSQAVSHLGLSVSCTSASGGFPGLPAASGTGPGCCFLLQIGLERSSEKLSILVLDSQ